jgi:hypothetical protein
MGWLRDALIGGLATGFLVGWVTTITDPKNLSLLLARGFFATLAAGLVLTVGESLIRRRRPALAHRCEQQSRRITRWLEQQDDGQRLSEAFNQRFGRELVRLIRDADIEGYSLDNTLALTGAMNGCFGDTDIRFMPRSLNKLARQIRERNARVVA